MNIYGLAKIGHLAVEVERLDRSCRDWFLQSDGRTIKEAPNWPVFKTAQEKFRLSLDAALSAPALTSPDRTP